MSAKGSKAAILAATGLASTPARAEALDELAADFWAWRAIYQPTTGDDIPRLGRPKDWAPDWRPETVAKIRADLSAYEARHKAIDASGWPVARVNDYRLIGSAIARVRWELDHLAAWRRNPHFYLDQAVTPIFEVLLVPHPFTSERVQTLIRLARSIPGTLNAATANLDDMRAPFARTTAAVMKDIDKQLLAVAAALAPRLDPEDARDLTEALTIAGPDLVQFAEWMETTCHLLPESTAVGREAYQFFLSEVALYPYSPEQILAMGQQEWDRSVVFENIERDRNAGLPDMPIYPDIEAQIKGAADHEEDIRRFLVENKIVSVPSWVKHYTYAAMPDFLAPISWIGVNTDQTMDGRLDEDATHFAFPPSPDLDYFWLTAAKDPRPLIIHEGVPGHFFQMAIAWAHENPIRRRYYDSGPNEGIGFYVEEMLLQAGIFDDSPKTREIIYSFMSLRALRVEIDVKLALGEFTIEQAAHYLETAVPIDPVTAAQEAAFFAASPGQAITYQIGKLQILEFLAKARRAHGADFDLRDAHDFLWKNGNVPITLLIDEYLARE